MTVKDRGQNLKVNDTVRLKFLAFNGGDYKDPVSITAVEIYKLFETDPTDDNPNGAVLVNTIESTSVKKDGTGRYHVDVNLEEAQYTTGRYQDVWRVIFESSLPEAFHDDYFTVYPNAWFTDSRPIIYSFSTDFNPNKIVKGCKKYIQIDISPDVPRAIDKRKYYENLISAGDLYISIKQECGQCLPAEEDLRLIVDEALVTERDKCVGYYFLDTTEMDCGIYYVWFKITLGPNVFISDKQPLQIFS